MKTTNLFKHLRFSLQGILILFALLACQKETVKTDVTFYNPGYKNVYITIGANTQIISPGESVTFYQVTGTSASYSAYTSGTTSSGSQVGIKLTWNEVLKLSGGTASYNLNISSDYFFLYYTNEGSDNLTPLYVNYGTTEQTVDNIELPNDGTKYRTGYYKAFTNTEIRVYMASSPAYYIYSDQGSNFTFPWTENQYVSIVNYNKKSAFDQTKENDIENKFTIGSLIKANDIKPYVKTDKNAIDLYCK